MNEIRSNIYKPPASLNDYTLYDNTRCGNSPCVFYGDLPPSINVPSVLTSNSPCFNVPSICYVNPVVLIQTTNLIHNK